MTLKIEFGEIYASYSLSERDQKVDVIETDKEVRLSGSGIHISYNKTDKSADVDIDFNLGASGGPHALDALLDLRRIFLEWMPLHGPAFPDFPFQVKDILQAIWVDLERAITSSVDAWEDFAGTEEDRVNAAKWLRSLPHGTPLLLLGSPGFFNGVENLDDAVIARVLLLDKSKGPATLFWPDNSHWRDFRPDEEDNQAVLPTSDVVSSLPKELLLPDLEPSLFQRADVIKATHGSRPGIRKHPAAATFALPTFNEWISRKAI